MAVGAVIFVALRRSADGSRVLFQLLTKRIQFLGSHPNEVALFRIDARRHIGDEFAERRDPFGLKSRLLGAEVTVDLGVAGNVPVGIAEDVVGEQILGVAGRWCAC
jgi:hypothetical protein